MSAPIVSDSDTSETRTPRPWYNTLLMWIVVALLFIASGLIIITKPFSPEAPIEQHDIDGYMESITIDMPQLYDA